VSRSLPAVVPIVDAGLGNSAYLVDLGNGRALVVDPPRDPRRIRAAADRAGTTIAYVAETHLHADFVSGARQLGAAGAQVLGAAADGRQFGHRALVDGEESDLGGLRLRAMATPGHTPGHLAYLLLDGDDPLGVFTGGSLLVGSAARTDLVDPDRAAEFARAQYASLRRLLDTLPDHTVVWPTHGAGSFCSAAPAGDRTSTIGTERASNPLVGAPSEEAFVEALLAASGSYPAYFRRLAEVNRRGPALMSKQPDLPALPPDEVAALLGAGGILVDVRPAAAFAAEHVPGAVCIPMRASFASWLGWLVEPDRPIVLVREPEQDVVDVTWRALEVGYERLAGELAGGMPAWVAAGRPTARIPRRRAPGPGVRRGPPARRAACRARRPGRPAR
jgi:hydroxyacylglutathione hydrolase